MSAAKESRNLYYRTLWEHAAAKPLAYEDHPWGDTVFKVRGKGKIFVFLGGESDEKCAGVGVKAPPDEVDSLLELPYIQRSKYIGRYGWVNVKVCDDEALKLALELVDDSYDLIAPKPKRKRATA
jgi:predicted DNA-binding protein (MmcQ/YjbR family)